MRLAVDRPLNLSTTDVKTERQRENEMAIGGMRHPRKAIGKIPGHEAVGQRVAAALEEFLDVKPHLEDCIQRIIVTNVPKAK